MGEALFELEQVLRSKKEKLTPQETNELLQCKSKAVKDFAVGALFGGSVGWAVTSKLGKFAGVYLSGGTAAFVGLWRFARSLNSSVEHILALDGSRIQKELANIMATRYSSDPLTVKLLSKHFYSEKVFDDSTSDQPKIRLRYRNIFSDHVFHGQRIRENDSHRSSQGDSYSDTHGDHNGNPDSQSSSRNISFESKKLNTNRGADITTDPLDFVFGYPAKEEQVQHPSTANMPPRMHTRHHRRSHRRHHRRNHDDLMDSEHA